jgi:hypothetical protein
MNRPRSYEVPTQPLRKSYLFICLFVFALQVAEVAASLNSEDVFILETPSKTWIWKGNVKTKICCHPKFFRVKLESE